MYLRLFCGIKLNVMLLIFFRVKEVCILLNFFLGFVVLLRDLFKFLESNVSEGEFILLVGVVF